MLNYVFFFLMAIVFFITGIILEWPYWLVGTLIMGIALLNIGYFLYISFASKNIRSIEKLMRKNKRDPMFGYLLALKEQDKEMVIENLNKLIQKYKKPTYANAYAFIIAFLQNDFEKAREHAYAIKDSPIGKYNVAMLDACLGHGEKHLHSEFQKPWMNEAIKATYYFTIGDKALYEQHKQLVLDYSKGIQFASNTYMLQWNEIQFQFGTLKNEL